MNRLLFIEDDDEIRLAIRLALEDEGYQVDEAGTDAPGSPCSTATSPDLVCSTSGSPTWSASTSAASSHDAASCPS